MPAPMMMTLSGIVKSEAYTIYHRWRYVEDIVFKHLTVSIDFASVLYSDRILSRRPNRRLLNMENFFRTGKSERSADLNCVTATTTLCHPVEI